MPFIDHVVSPLLLCVVESEGGVKAERVAAPARLLPFGTLKSVGESVPKDGDMSGYSLRSCGVKLKIPTVVSGLKTVVCLESTYVAAIQQSRRDLPSWFDNKTSILDSRSLSRRVTIQGLFCRLASSY